MFCARPCLSPDPLQTSVVPNCRSSPAVRKQTMPPQGEQKSFLTSALSAAAIFYREIDTHTARPVSWRRSIPLYRRTLSQVSSSSSTPHSPPDRAKHFPPCTGRSSSNMPNGMRISPLSRSYSPVSPPRYSTSVSSVAG